MAPRTARAAVREAEVRAEPAREPVRAKTRTRRPLSINPMSLPRDLLRAFWQEGNDLQWNTETVIGVPATQFENTQMQQQGWEPVTLGMFDGRLDYLMPNGSKGQQIIYGASRLDWRPKELTEEARAEELQDARHARGVEERKIASAQPDGVDQGFMDSKNPAAQKGNFLRKEHGRVPSMAIPE